MQQPETSLPEQDGLYRIERFLDDMFTLSLPGFDDACFVGGLLSRNASRARHRVSVSGAGFSPSLARRSCLGEAAEYLSFLLRPDDPLVVRGPGSGRDSGPDDALVFCRDAVSGEAVAVPSHLVLRDPDLPDARTRTTSNGVGAGRSLEGAKLHALLEIVERHEVMCWWLLQEPRQGVAESVVRSFLPEAGLSPGACEGPPGPWFLHLTARTGIQVIGAFCENRITGEVACGFKAATDLTSALRGAFLELRQHQLALHLARLRGAEASALKVADFPCLSPDALGADFKSTSNANSFNELCRHLHRQGVRVLWADLTRPNVGVPVARVLSCQLQGSSRNSIIDALGVGNEEYARLNHDIASLPDLY